MFIFSTLHAFVLCIPGMLTRAQDNETDNQVHVADLLSELTRGLTPNQVKMVTWHVGIKRVAIAWLGFSRALLEAGQARRHPAHFCRYPRDVQECRFVECEVTQTLCGCMAGASVSWWPALELEPVVFNPQAPLKISQTDRHADR